MLKDTKMKYINNIRYGVLIGCILLGLYASAQNANTLFIPDSTYVPAPLLNVPKTLPTSSYASASGEQLAKMPASNFTNSLFGLLPGLTALQGSGEPGAGNAYLTIRGLGSYNYPAMTYCIDGYQTDLMNLSPSEIESVTILKDAAALAPFGMKGAHGIVWITTKRGVEGKPVISLEFQTGLQKPTVLSKPLSATDYAQLYNEAYSNDLGAWNSYYKIPEDIKHNTNWYDKVLKSTALIDRKDVTIRGGSPLAKYFVLLGHSRSDGLYRVGNDDSHSNAKYDQYIIKANLDFSMLKFFEGRVNISSHIEDRSNPNYDTTKLWNNLASYPNLIYEPINPNGSYPGTATYSDNPYASIRALGLKTMHDRNLIINFDLKEKLDFITPDLYIKQGVSFSTWTRDTRIVSRNYSRIIDGVAQTTDRDSNYEVKDDYGTNQWNRLQFKLGLGYSHDFGDSRLNAAVDYLQYLYHIDANLNGKAGLSNDYAFQNIGGRIYYNLRNRYAAELGFAISGSDNYKKGNRFGFYHALSFAWNIFNEQHPATNKNINLLRLRASVGTTGNDQYNGERYLYQKYYSSIGGGGFATGNDDPTWHTAIGLRSIPNADIFAEKSYKYNLGIDAEFFKHLNVTLDAFLNKHEGIVTPDNSLSSVFGATPPYRNIGKVTNKGFEIAANYTSSIGRLTYTLGANASYAINKIDAMAEYDALTEASAQIANTIAN
ncbi:SusC/RagA family TonB-linked outer membrane protein [Capnocytophaga haemolytica]|jgi:tonB-linked outer membrane protein, susC/ragA family